MKIKIKAITSIFIALFVCGAIVFAQTDSSKAAVAVPVDIEIPFPPIPVKAMDKIDLAYEIHITNFGRTNLALTGVEVFADDASSTALANYRDAELVKRLAVMNFTNPAQEKNVIGAGQRAIVFLMITTDAAKQPRALKHRLSFKSIAAPAANNTATVAPTDEKEQTIENIKTIVQTIQPLVVGSPIRGRWMAINGLSNDTGHRRSLIPVDGHVRIAQRYATDWVKLGDDGLIARNGDLSQNANYYGYGAEAVAVADATVIDIKDGIPENVPQTKKRAVPITLDTVAGNYVLLDLGKGYYALYAHFQPNSLKVKIGDRVKAGQTLGLVGNSGNSDLPHLHFHIANAPSALGAEGVPYVLKSFTMQGVANTAPEAIQEFIKNGFKPDPSQETKRQMELPVENAVIVLQ